MKKEQTATWLIRIFSLAILIVTAVWTISRIDLISLIGTEDVYWERARFFLGEGGATLYNGSSLCSLGYSLILLPICSVLKSPYAAYKAAVLLNAVFLCAAYLVLTAAASRLFSNEKKSFLSAACFFAVFCPALMTVRSYTGPEMAVLFLICLCIYFLALLWDSPRNLYLVLLTISLILIAFLQITALGLIIGIAILLGFYVKEKRIGENAFLTFLIVLLLGVAAGNIAERGVLYAFAKDMGITGIQSSLEVLISGIFSFTESGFLLTLSETVIGKLYSVLIATLLLLCPALWWFCGRIRHHKEENLQGSLPVLGMFGLFLAQFVWICLYDASLGVGQGMLSLSGLEMLLPFVLLLGIVKMKSLKSWETTFPFYLLLLCVCTFATAGTVNFEKAKGSSGVYDGFLMIFQGLSKTTNVVTIYMAACIVMLICLLLAAVFLSPIRKKWLNTALKGAGIAAAFAVFSVVNVQSLQATAESKTVGNQTAVAPIAAVITDADINDGCVYLSDNSSDKKVPVLQSLLPENPITVIKDDQERNEFLSDLEDQSELPLILTDTDGDEIEEQLQKEYTQYQVSYMTNSYTIWAARDSADFTALEGAAEGRVDSLVLKSMTEEEVSAEDNDEEDDIEDEDEEEEESETALTLRATFEGTQNLAPGTYRAYLDLHTDDLTAGSGTVTISDSDGTIRSLAFDETVFDENGNAQIYLDFGDRVPMYKIKVKVEGTLLSSVNVKQIYWQKLTSDYTLGVDDLDKVDSVAGVILDLDDQSGKTGTVAYVDYSEDTSDLSVNAFEERLPDNEISLLAETELDELDTDYLIMETWAHAFYPVMDDYSVIYRGNSYMVFVRNDSDQYQTAEENVGILSSGTEIAIQAWTRDRGVNASIPLEMGDYLYKVSLKYDPADLTGEDQDTAATLYLETKSKKFAEQPVTYGQLREGKGDLTVEIPLVLSSDRSNLVCRLENDSSAEIQATPQSIELQSQKYQYGKEESSFSELLQTINRIEEARVYVVQSKGNIQDQRVMYSWIEGQIPDAQVEEIRYADSYEMSGDAFLVTRGLNSSTLKLCSSYSILAHAGRYTLWVKSDGAYLQELTESGVSVLSSGDKVSPESLIAMNGNDKTEGITLPSGSYKVTVELTAPELDPDDTVEVILYRDKTKSEVKEELSELLTGGSLTENEAEEVASLLDNGYTEKELSKYIDPKEKCGSATYKADKFTDADGSILVTVKISSESVKMTNLSYETNTWRGGQAEAEVVWVELN